MPPSLLTSSHLSRLSWSQSACASSVWVWLALFRGQYPKALFRRRTFHVPNLRLNIKFDFGATLARHLIQTALPHQTKNAVPNWFRRRSFAVICPSTPFREHSQFVKWFRWRTECRAKVKFDKTSTDSVELLPHLTKTAVPNWFRQRSFAILNSSVRFGTWVRVERRLNWA